MDKKIIEVLKQIKNDYGVSIFRNKNRFNSLLSDYATGQYKGEINLLNMTLSLGLLNEVTESPTEYNKIRSRYIMKMKTEYFWTEDQAVFAVDVWGVVMGAVSEFSDSSNSNKFYGNMRSEPQTNAEDRLISIKEQLSNNSKVNFCGNSVGNITNGGLVAKQGDWIFFSDHNNNKRLSRIHKVKGDKTILNTSQVNNINVVGEWIFYCEVNYKFITPINKLNKIKTDGSSKMLLTEDNCQYINVIDDWIYYCNKGDNLKIYKIKTDGTNKTKLTDDRADYLNVIDDYAYYSNISDKRNIYRIHINGTARMKINEGQSTYLNVSNGWIYYAEGNENLCKIRVDGKDKTLLCNGDIRYINVVDNWIFYQNKNKNENTYKIQTNGKNISQINYDKSRNLNVIGEWIYYIKVPEHDSNSGWKLYKILVDGSNREQIN
jgi:hypothetical protein